jgi:hypothetical protein
VGTHAVLVHAKDRSPGFACGLSTTAVRWRPMGVRGGRGACEAGQRGGKKDQGHGEDDTWKGKKQEVDDGDRHSGGRRSCTGGRVGGAAEQRSRGGSEEEEEGGSPRTSLEYLESSGASR